MTGVWWVGDSSSFCLCPLAGVTGPLLPPPTHPAALGSAAKQARQLAVCGWWREERERERTRGDEDRGVLLVRRLLISYDGATDCFVSVCCGTFSVYTLLYCDLKDLSLSSL